MMRTSMKRLLSVLVSLTLVVAFAFPTTALAAQQEVQVDNHTTVGQKAVTDIAIDDVDAPVAGSQLDDKAVVKTAEGETWDIPVLWIGDDLQLATQAVEGRTYLPALAFFVPNDFTVEGSSFSVKLSEPLAKLFGTDNIVSVYIPSTGITYILPASLRDFFVPANVEAQPQSSPAAATQQPAVSDGIVGPSIVDIYCAQTARDKFTDEDLEWILDLVINKLQPQAVNLLIDKFPAFTTASQNGEIGERISLYVYLNNGDKDGLTEHESAASALAYVSAMTIPIDDTYKYAYMIGVDLDDLVKRKAEGNDDDSSDNYFVNPETGKYVLLRNGESMTTLQNTIIHELFHALMQDYNRTGMAGGIALDEIIVNRDGTFKSEAQKKTYAATRYPVWFMEGTASMVENSYTFRKGAFDALSPATASKLPMRDRAQAVLSSYVNNSRIGIDGGTILVDLGLSGIDTNRFPQYNPSFSRYVSGYLATMYLSELAARSNESIGSSMGGTDESHITFSADKLRLGLNSILERMHKGETLDSVVRSISVTKAEDGTLTPLYKGIDDFEAKFIKGEGTPTDETGDSMTYSGDATSLIFVVTFLDYLRSFENSSADGTSSGFVANGSILKDFSENFASPLDPSKNEQSSFLKIVENNAYEVSTVPDSTALNGGGKLRSSVETDVPAGDSDAVYPDDDEGVDWTDLEDDMASFAEIKEMMDALEEYLKLMEAAQEADPSLVSDPTEGSGLAGASDLADGAATASAANDAATGDTAAGNAAAGDIAAGNIAAGNAAAANNVAPASNASTPAASGNATASAAVADDVADNASGEKELDLAA